MLKALDCNSDLQIDLPDMVMPNTTVQATLRVVNGLATDALNNNVEQRFEEIILYPSCLSTLPCDPDTSLPFSYAGAVSTTCSVDFPWNADTTDPNAVVFTFEGGLGGTAMGIGGCPTTAPPTCVDGDALTLPAALTGEDTSECELVFELMVAPDFAGSNDLQASTMGLCDPEGEELTSSADSTARVSLVLVPTLGEMALILLALLLGASAWLVLRRREGGSPA